MGIPSSGQISMLRIANETGLRPVNISLRNLSNIAGFSTPDKITDFYSYSQTDAERYKNAVNNTGYTLSGTEESAIDTLFTELNNSGLLGKIFAFYPMIGDIPQAQVLNAKSEGDVRQWQYDLSFNGSWSFGAYGATGDGSTTNWTANYSYATTTNLKNSHLGTYITAQGTYNYGWDMGVFDSSTNYPYAFMTMYDGYTGNAIYDYDYSDGVTSFQPSNYSGNNMMTYDGANSKIRAYQNESQFQYFANSVETYSTTTWIVGGYDYINAQYTDKTFGFITFGKRLDAAEMQDYQAYINDFQTTLGRNTY
jgi:hypothetical protein